MDNTTENWISRFTAQNGRPPRILHIGNVCNNAYQTAKMLNAAGADCDVLNGDDYYVMTHPEWDDADFEGNVGNTYFPAFHKLDLHGFERPRWYAQAPLNLAVDYLIAKREGNSARAQWLWSKMERARRGLSTRESGSRYGNFLKWAAERKSKIAGTVPARLDYLRQVLAELFTKPATFAKRLRMKLGRLDEAETARLLQMDSETQAARRKAMLDKIMDWDALTRVHRDAESLFPSRDIRFDTQLESFMLHLPQLKRLFGHYDVIQAYADQVVWPYLAGVDFVGYEHGTLRDYVYEENDLSRLTLLGFASAKAVYLTNIDCCDSAVYLTQSNKVPIVYGLHGIDVERIIQKINLAVPKSGFDGRFGVPRDTPLFFSPSRHTWLEDKQLYLKGDDKVVRAAARLAAEGFRFKLALASWGGDVARIQAEIAQHPWLADCIIWTSPLGKAEFYTVLQQADSILDQFHLHVFGGITIETLSANAAALITCSIPAQRLAHFFEEPPPYLSADSEDDIYAAMKKVLEHPGETRALAAKGRAWVEKYHSHASIVRKNCEAYSCF